MEHIVFHSIMKHLDKYNDYQYGFRQGHSSETPLITIVEDILYAMDHHKQVDLILLDFRKAFDTVPHRRLYYQSYYLMESVTRFILGLLLG